MAFLSYRVVPAKAGIYVYLIELFEFAYLLRRHGFPPARE
jgi:hypothetical protein